MTSELDILTDWIRRETGHKDPIGPDDDLLEARILDSFSIVTIAVFIQERFGIELQPEDLVRSKLGRLSSMVALIGASFAGSLFLGVEPASFYNGFTSGRLTFGDVAHGLTKSVAFGVMIALASCHFGMSTSGGAPGVGRAVNSTVVASAAGIFVLDYLLSFAIG